MTKELQRLTTKQVWLYSVSCGAFAACLAGSAFWCLAYLYEKSSYEYPIYVTFFIFGLLIGFLLGRRLGTKEAKDAYDFAGSFQVGNYAQDTQLSASPAKTQSAPYGRGATTV